MKGLEREWIVKDRREIMERVKSCNSFFSNNTLQIG